MAADRSGNYLRGILVPDPRINLDAIVDKTHGTVPSSYTEAGPMAGAAVAGQSTKLRLRTSGTQAADSDIEMLTVRSGGVDRDGGAFVWRSMSGGDDADEYKGGDAPCLITDIDALRYTTSADVVALRPHVITLASGKLLASFSVSSLGVVRISVYDPATSLWTDASLAPTEAGAGYTTGAVTLGQLRSGRVVALCSTHDGVQVDAYISDDDGDTWALGGARVLDDGVEAAISDMRLCVSPESGEAVLFVVRSVGGNLTAAQYASADDCSRFDSVLFDWEATAGESIEAIDVIPAIGGGFVVLYVDSQATPDELRRRIIGSAYEDVTTAAQDEVSAEISPALFDVAGWRDPDGSLWCIANNGDTASGLSLGAMYWSQDNGQTWSRATRGYGTCALHTGTTTTNRFQRWSAAHIGGRVAVVTRWTSGTTTYDNWSVLALWYGGYSSQTAPASEEDGVTLISPSFSSNMFISWGSFALPGSLWAPADVPTALNWTAGGGGALGALTDDAVLEIDTAAADRYYYRDISDDNTDRVFADVLVQLESGSGDSSADEVTFAVRIASAASFQYEVQVRLSDTGYRVYDPNAAAYVGSAQTYDLTQLTHIRVALDTGGNVLTWHCRPGHVREWVPGVATDGVTDGGAGATNRIIFGHTGATTSVSQWRLVGYNYWGWRWSGTQTGTLASSWDNPADLRATPYAGGARLLDDGVSVEAKAGPTWYGETHRIATAYATPVDAMLPSSSPSPRMPWRSKEDNVNTAIVFDLEPDVGGSSSLWASPVVGVFLLNSNLQNCKLQGWTGAAWEDLITLDAGKGYSTLPFTRSGRFITPNGVASNSNWLFHEAHAGDTIALDDGETKTLRRVAHNSEGGWAGASLDARVELDTETLTGSEPATGNATIFRRNFGSVVNNFTSKRRYVRLYIPAQETADGYYQIGTLAIGPVFVFGLQPGRGWSDERSPVQEIVTRRDGSRSVRQDGPMRRTVELSWSEQVNDTTSAWGVDPNPDYVSGSGGAVATIADTLPKVLGLVERVDGAASPCVYIGRIGRGSGTLNYSFDAEWLYGRITTSNVSLDHVVGDEGVSPVMRGNRIRIEGET